MRVIAGELRGRTIRTGEGGGCRPATGKVRQAVFSMLEARGLCYEGLAVLDLFAGSGSLGIEALSRGAERVWFVEADRRLASLIGENLAAFGVAGARWRVLAADALAVLRRRPQARFGLICIDPPYGKNLLAPALAAALDRDWLAPGGFLLAEIEARAAFDPARDAAGLALETDRTYGQTRIILWSRPIPESPCTPEPSTP
jgi:16S rRNA (guanine966-N2)-methyltransferase